MIPIIGAEFSKKIIPLLDQAKQNLDIVVFDWRWYPDQPGSFVQLFNQAVVRCVRRGVLVRAVVNSPDILAQLQKVGVMAKRLKTPRLIHCKLMIIDNEKLVIGSHNYTASAFNMNMEASAIIDLPDGAGRFGEFFNRIYQM